MPLATLVLGIGGMTALVMTDALDPIMQFYTMIGLVLGTPLLLVVWLLFFSGLRWWQRLVYLLVGAGVAAGVVVGLWLFTYQDGSISGSGIPRLRWIGSKRPEVADLKIEDATKD